MISCSWAYPSIHVCSLVHVTYVSRTYALPNINTIIIATEPFCAVAVNFWVKKNPDEPNTVAIQLGKRSCFWNFPVYLLVTSYKEKSDLPHVSEAHTMKCHVTGVLPLFWSNWEEYRIYFLYLHKIYIFNSKMDIAVSTKKTSLQRDYHKILKKSEGEKTWKSWASVFKFFEIVPVLPSLTIISSLRFLFIFFVFFYDNKSLFWDFRKDAKNRWHGPLWPRTRKLLSGNLLLMFGLVEGKNFSWIVFCLLVPLSDTPYRRQLLKSYPEAFSYLLKDLKARTSPGPQSSLLSLVC